MILIETKIIVPCLILSVIFLVLLLTHELCRPGHTKQLFLLMRFNAAMMLLLYYIDVKGLNERLSLPDNHTNGFLNSMWLLLVWDSCLSIAAT